MPSIAQARAATTPAPSSVAISALAVTRDGVRLTDVVASGGVRPVSVTEHHGLVYVLNTGLQAIVNYWGHALGISIETEMRRQAFDHIQKLSFRYFDNNKSGALITHVTKDLEEVGEVAHHGPEALFTDLLLPALAESLLQGFDTLTRLSELDRRQSH